MLASELAGYMLLNLIAFVAVIGHLLDVKEKAATEVQPDLLCRQAIAALVSLFCRQLCCPSMHSQPIMLSAAESTSAELSDGLPCVLHAMPATPPFKQVFAALSMLPLADWFALLHQHFLPCKVLLLPH